MDNIFDITGMWVAVFLTFCIYSFLFKDNPFYKFTEHLFIGISAGYWVARYTQDILIQKLFNPLFFPGNKPHDWWLFIPLFLGIMMLLKLVPRISWASRWPIAFVVGTTLGITIIASLQSDILMQVQATIKDFQMKPYVLFIGADKTVGNQNGKVSLQELDQFKKLLGQFPPKDLDKNGKIGMAEAAKAGLDERFFKFLDTSPPDGALSQAEMAELTAARQFFDKPDFKEFIASADHDGDKEISPAEWRTGHLFSGKWYVLTQACFNGILFVIGVSCGLIYFFFSKEHTGVFGMASRLGIYFLMICFGASFGYTVMARISLLIGRMIDVIFAFHWLGQQLF